LPPAHHRGGFKVTLKILSNRSGIYYKSVVVYRREAKHFKEFKMMRNVVQIAQLKRTIERLQVELELLESAKYGIGDLVLHRGVKCVVFRVEPYTYGNRVEYHLSDLKKDGLVPSKTIKGKIVQEDDISGI
jgi:hypothetical protein